MSDVKLDALKATALFSSCNAKQLELIGRVTDRVTLPAGRVIVEVDTVPTHMVIVVDGTASVEVDGTQVAELGAGEVIGELSLVDDHRASATVTATSDVDCWVVAHAGFKPVWEENPDISTALLHAVVPRLRAANQLVH